MFTLGAKGNQQEASDPILLILPTNFQKYLKVSPQNEDVEAAYDLIKRYQKLLDDALTGGGIVPLNHPPDPKIGHKAVLRLIKQEL